MLTAVLKSALQAASAQDELCEGAPKMADTFQRVFLGGLGARPTRRFGMTAAMGGMVPRLVDVVSGCARSPSPAPPTHTHVLLRHCDRPPSAISHADAPATQIAAESAAELLEAAFDGKLCQDNVVMQPGSLYWDAAACSAKVRRVAYSSRRLKGSRDDLLEENGQDDPLRDLALPASFIDEIDAVVPRFCELLRGVSRETVLHAADETGFAYSLLAAVAECAGQLPLPRTGSVVSAEMYYWGISDRQVETAAGMLIGMGSRLSEETADPSQAVEAIATFATRLPAGDRSTFLKTLRPGDGCSAEAAEAARIAAADASGGANARQLRCALLAHRASQQPGRVVLLLQLPLPLKWLNAFIGSKRSLRQHETGTLILGLGAAVLMHEDAQVRCRATNMLTSLRDLGSSASHPTKTQLAFQSVCRGEVKVDLAAFLILKLVDTSLEPSERALFRMIEVQYMGNPLEQMTSRPRATDQTIATGQTLRKYVERLSAEVLGADDADEDGDGDEYDDEAAAADEANANTGAGANVGAATGLRIVSAFSYPPQADGTPLPCGTRSFAGAICALLAEAVQHLLPQEEDRAAALITILREGQAQSGWLIHPHVSPEATSLPHHWDPDSPGMPAQMDWWLRMVARNASDFYTWTGVPLFRAGGV